MQPELAVVAGRVSTRDQADRGYSLPEQVAAGLAYVHERGYQLADVPGFSNVAAMPAQPGIFIEDYTGTTMDRPALDSMREIVKPHGITRIIFTELDRLNRGPGWYAGFLEDEFAELGAKIEYALERFSDDDDGDMFKDIKAALAARERKTILRRTRTGKIGRAKSGKVLISDRPPYGYRKSVDGTMLAINEDEEAIVKDIYRWYIEGLSPRAIARRLNEQHVQAYTGPVSHMACHGWSPTSITGILRNETYTGTWFFNKYRIERKPGQPIKKSAHPRAEWIGVAVPPIIDAETFARARDQAQRNKASASRNRKRLYLFSGMLTCDACGWTYRGGYNMQCTIYRCGARLEKHRYGHEPCRMPQFSERALDAAIWPWLTGILREPEQAIRAAQAQAEERREETDRLDARLARVDAKLADVRRRITSLDDSLEVETDAENRSALRERKAQRTKERRELEAERATLIAQQERSPWACQNIAQFLDWFRQLARQAEPVTPETKRRTYELANLHVRLEVRDGMKLAHVTCIAGEKTLAVGSIANVASSCFRRFPFKLSTD